LDSFWSDFLSSCIKVPLLFLRFSEKYVQEVDPCDDLTDEDIRTAIQNATGPKNIIFVPEV
jgi:dynamin 1-like protein